MARTYFLRSCLIGLILVPAAEALAREEKFELSHAVPRGVFLMVASRHNPQHDFVDKAWGEVFTALEKSGVGEELWNLVTKAGSQGAKRPANGDDEEEGENGAEKKQDKLQEAADQFSKLFKSVRWRDLASKEFVLTGRMGTPMPDFVLLFRGGEADKNYKALGGILKELKRRAGDNVKLETSEKDGADLTSLRAQGTPLVLTLGRREDVVILSVGEGLLNEVLGLLSGKSEGKALTSTPRFKDAFKHLPAAEDQMVFFDVSLMLKDMRKMFEQIGEMTKNDEDGRKVMKFVKSLLDDMGVIDYVAATSRTDGMRVFEDEWVALTPGAKDKPTYPIFVGDAAIERFDKYVPKDAVSFSVSREMRLDAIYKYAGQVVREHIPNGEQAWEKWEQLQEQLNFSVEKDVLAWLGDETMSVELPASGTLGGGNPVWAVRVKDERKAEEKIRAGITALGKRFTMGDMPAVVTTPTKVAGHEGFYSIEIRHPMMAMVAAKLQPTWGVYDGYLFFGINKAGIARCLKTAAGEVDSIVKSERFRKEALQPTGKEGKLISISFTDTTGTAEGVQAALGSVGMLGMFAGMSPDSKEVGEVFGAIAGIAQKLMPVAAKLNFFQSDAEYETFHGDGWRRCSVKNYRKPPSDEGKDDEDWNDSWGDKDKEKNKKKEGDEGRKEKPKAKSDGDKDQR